MCGRNRACLPSQDSRIRGRVKRPPDPRGAFPDKFRAIQGQNDRDAQVVCGAKPLLQYITLRIQDYLDPRTAEPLGGEDGSVLWDPAELKVPDWLYTDRGEAIAAERRARLAAVLPKAKEAAMGFPGGRCPGCGLPLLLTGPTTEPSYCAVCKGNVLWEWSWMREQVEVAFSSARRSVGPPA